MRHLLLLSTLFFFSHLTHAQSTDSLKVISWNVFLRPGILKDEQLKRVDSIAASLLKIDADVLILQEVFHKKSRKRLIAALSKSYPFHTKMGRKSFWGVPSGNCIFSKDSIRSQAFIYYKKAIKADQLAKKGAIRIEIEHQGMPFSIIGTHLQAGGAEKGAQVRKNQIDQLTRLAEGPNPNAVGLFAGDFNIKFQDTLYHYILESLHAQNLEPTDKKLGTANFSDQTMTSTSGTPKWIDFILMKSKNDVVFRTSHIEEPRCYFEDQCERISDHNPIITVFEW